MKLLGKNFKTLATASLLTLGMAGSSLVAASTTLVVGTWMPPSNPMNATALPTWAQWVEEATEGRVRVRIEQGLGNPASFYQMVEDGVMNAGWSFHGYLPGRFSLPMAVEQPGLGVTAEAASAALWQVHEKHFAKADQYEGLELLGLFTHGPGQIHTREPINSLADLRNKRIRIGGGVQAALGQRMGVSAVSAPGPQVYEMLQQGVADGVFMPAGEQRSARLAEVAPNLTLLPGGMYLGSFAFFIDPEFMKGLDPRDAEAIRRVSGYKFSVMAGKAWDQDDVEGIAFARSQGVNVMELSDDHRIVREFRELSKGMDQAWIDSVRRTGVDAAAALADLRRIAREYAAKN
ncbi:TRAP transporter substrate-binding protein [Marinospirillum alkaliphilum]|uniref:TRAP-type C4-dicarboxylate transport system, substrate-binding protein n=1 Tax=Marinospirillum alkaliphilum DSM 21637 TaxID=1122209 RepID=A0A1K1V163_9GAMM|nr:TRAP transporter substrate-binding protein [Marinospirillum alkaliphilum]SFX18842.1 TRAP-type C4-dicarboxylate transport system, substrate-binding protein [Marinospirillum alkaliphilum DSM 21637]